MKYLCTNCNYVFDKAIGDKEEGIAIGAEIDKCPVCKEYDVFQGIKEEINYISGDDLLSLEIDHYPEIEIKKDKIIVTVGNEIHPMGLEHRIAAVGLYDEYGDLVKVNYLELETEAVTEFDFDNLDEFEIRVNCSVHGLWARKFVN
ncbi:MAG: desulfoferrodoxin family protein [Candidatus Gracilibacteria bacterium]